MAAVGRSLVANLVNGVWLRRGGVVATGHYIRLEGLSEIEGYVERIGARTTLIQTPSGDLARVPNTILANSVFTSFHLDPARDAVTVDVEADTDVSPRRVVSVLRQETKALAHSVPGQVAGPDRIQQLPGRFPGCRRFVMRWNVHDATQRDEIQREIGRRVIDRLHREGIRTPTLPQPRDKP
ncbi:MAG TPA: mechanosensitive ion channel domain-containing protein [Candidatus Thermoplasmatota archaeon]|nr:mechanosensitive ion channel domain-containing protein [Candidatus Thermoplasmatota archaeon]